MKCVLVSHRFNPGHLSHIMANKSLITDIGGDVYFRWNKKFITFSGDNSKNRTISLSECINLSKGDLFIIWFPSLHVLIDLFFIKFFTRATIVYIYHEPYSSFSDYLNSGFGFVKVIKITLTFFISYLICALSNKIILPSNNAWITSKGSQKSPFKYHKLNLMFEDEAETLQPLDGRRYISYIGTIAKDHAFEEFFTLMQSCIRLNLLNQYVFLIATKNNLPISLVPIIEELCLKGCLEVYTGKPLSNKDINYFFSKSVVVWNAYKRSMQSGILPKAFMFGTPVLISNNNPSEFFENCKNGIMISSKYDLSEFVSAIDFIFNNFSYISNNCREKFNILFNYKSLSDDFIEFIFKDKK